MSDIIRQSPVRFDAGIVRKTTFDGWEIVQEFAGGADGPWLVDLSHLQRWDYQHSNLDAQLPAALKVPARPGQVSLQDGRLINRMNRTQLSIWHLDMHEVRELPADVGFTDLTEAHCMLAVVGRQTPAVMEQVCNLDLFEPGRPMPFLTQGPVMHIPCQVVTLSQTCVLMTFSRGYGQTFAEAMLHSASGCGLRPGGADVFSLVAPCNSIASRKSRRSKKGAEAP